MERIEPSSGSEFGGNRVVLSGQHFPFFSKGITVLVHNTLECKDVRIVKPFRSLSCVMPKCLHCGTVDVKIMMDVREAATLSPGSLKGSKRSKAEPPEINSVKYTFEEKCYSGSPPLLPRPYSKAENCTACAWVVSGAMTIVGDIVSNQAIRQALREICATQHITYAGRVTETYCRIDLSAACAVLYHTSGDQLADAIWDRWDGAYLFGGLPQAACAAIGRCDLELPTHLTTIT